MQLKKILAVIVITFLIIFSSNKVFAKESAIEDKIISEVTEYVYQNKLSRFHLDYVEDPGYQTYYYKLVYLAKDFDKFSKYSENQIKNISLLYEEEMNETWEFIFDNMDIDPELLNQNQYLGIYWDTRTYRLNLIWSCHYTPSEYTNILEITESGKTYKLYNNQWDKADLKYNWNLSTRYHFKEYDLTLNVTPIAAITNGVSSGIPLKSVYNFEGFTYGIDDALYPDSNTYYNSMFEGKVEGNIDFDLQSTPSTTSKSVMQLVSHAYEIIEDCEVQSYYSLNFNGYVHQAVFNTTIDLDQIYRVDVSYKVTNDNKQWYQFWLSNDEHQITKSLTPEKKSGGIFGLTSYQGFEEGSFQSTDSKATNYKYRLHLNYDENNWNIFNNAPYQEANYKRVSEFQIFRLNYLSNGKVYDVAIQMDLIEGETKFFFDMDMILDTETFYYEVKKEFDDFIRSIGDLALILKYLLITLGVFLGISLVFWVGIKIKDTIKYLLE
ncbi:MAG: hypothetical protein R3Y21_05225 [Mycoplasmatota bacterium]